MEPGLLRIEVAIEETVVATVVAGVEGRGAADSEGISHLAMGLSTDSRANALRTT